MRNKEKIELMEEEIQKLNDKISALTHVLNALTSAHSHEPNGYHYPTKNGTITCGPRYFHADTSSAVTENCGVVTFKELARYVIDKEPIAREVTVTKYFEHPDNAQSSNDDTEDKP